MKTKQIDVYKQHKLHNESFWVKMGVGFPFIPTSHN